METQQQVKTIDLSMLSAAELEKALKDKQKQEREMRAQKKETYETNRDEMIRRLISGAKELNRLLSQFKGESLTAITNFKEEAHAYGEIRSNSKGGFNLRTSDGQFMVSYDRNVKPEYDERAGIAEGLLKEFLEDKVKKKDLQTYRTIAALMERNSKGDFTPARISSLLKIEDNYDDERWVKAMRLFRESFQNVDISYSLSFYEKNEQSKDEPISLSFTSL